MATTVTAAQQRFLDAAVDVFAEQGYGGATTREIAVRAGRSPAALYVHYPTKEDLLFAICLQGHELALQCLQSAYDSGGDPVSRVREMVFRFSTWHMERVRRARVSQYELHSLSPEHRIAIIALRREFHRLMRRALQSGIRAGVFDVDDVHRTAHSLLALGIDLVRWFDPALEKDIAGIARHNAELAVRMVRRHPEPPRSPRT